MSGARWPAYAGLIFLTALLPFRLPAQSLIPGSPAWENAPNTPVGPVAVHKRIPVGTIVRDQHSNIPIAGALFRNHQTVALTETNGEGEIEIPLIGYDSLFVIRAPGYHSVRVSMDSMDMFYALTLQPDLTSYAVQPADSLIAGFWKNRGEILPFSGFGMEFWYEMRTITPWERSSIEAYGNIYAPSGLAETAASSSCGLQARISHTRSINGGNPMPPVFTQLLLQWLDTDVCLGQSSPVCPEDRHRYVFDSLQAIAFDENPLFGLRWHDSTHAGKVWFTREFAPVFQECTWKAGDSLIWQHITYDSLEQQYFPICIRQKITCRDLVSEASLRFERHNRSATPIRGRIPDTDLNAPSCRYNREFWPSGGCLFQIEESAE